MILLLSRRFHACLRAFVCYDERLRPTVGLRWSTSKNRAKRLIAFERKFELAEPSELVLLLKRMGEGVRAVAESPIPRVYQDWRALAVRRMAAERRGATRNVRRPSG